MKLKDFRNSKRFLELEELPMHIKDISGDYDALQGALEYAHGLFILKLDDTYELPLGPFWYSSNDLWTLEEILWKYGQSEFSA